MSRAKAPETGWLLESLRTGDHLSLCTGTVRPLLALMLLTAYAILPRRRRRTDELAENLSAREPAVLFVVANPVAHGQVLAHAVVQAADVALARLEDTRLGSSRAGAHAFPSFAPRSLAPWASLRDLLRGTVLFVAAARTGGVGREMSNTGLWYAVVAQSVRTRNVREVLSRLEGLRLVLVDFDRHAVARPWVECSRELGIRSATLVHGSPTEATYRPVVANAVLAWSESQAAWFAADDVETLVVGRADVPVLAARASGLRVVIAHSRERLSESEEARLLSVISVFADAGWPSVLRLHPSVQSLSDLDDPSWLRIAKKTEVELARQGELQRSLSSARLVVVVASTAGVDALYSGVPVLVLADRTRQVPVELRSLAAKSDEHHRMLLSADGPAVGIQQIAEDSLDLRPVGLVGDDARKALRDAIASLCT